MSRHTYTPLRQSSRLDGDADAEVGAVSAPSTLASATLSRLTQRSGYTRLSEGAETAPDTRMEDEWAEIQRRRLHPTDEQWKAIYLAIVLTLLGSVLFLAAAAVLAGFIRVKEWERAFIALFLSMLLLVPGVFHLGIAVLAYLRVPGYSYDMIPSMA
eukprot:TRINITY_DN10446_c0_g1_i1.p1 TRINITY_DN10446_c0_g1~~TRINITY_DN10446_c0_g1_i1.p1  ORF type:complete len:157 (-),score=24.11 TRINITY_DN10446_c0_g1_i1:443-913(-)